MTDADLPANAEDAMTRPPHAYLDEWVAGRYRRSATIPKRAGRWPPRCSTSRSTSWATAGTSATSAR